MRYPAPPTKRESVLKLLSCARDIDQLARSAIDIGITIDELDFHYTTVFDVAMDLLGLPPDNTDELDEDSVREGPLFPDGIFCRDGYKTRFRESCDDEKFVAEVEEAVEAIDQMRSE